MKILVVDDSPIQQKIAAFCLSELGEIVKSDSVKGATLQLMTSLKSKEPFNLIALDFNLGDGNGFDLVHKLRNMESAFHANPCRVVYITASLDGDSIQDQCSEYETVLAKPIKLDKVLEKLKELNLEVK
ncbi:MAG: response regulator [Candidatus Cloacimonetes bacterium]|nr:response regulator [Candidatus Cloacimonadota bacterium]